MRASLFAKKDNKKAIRLIRMAFILVSFSLRTILEYLANCLY